MLTGPVPTEVKADLRNPYANPYPRTGEDDVIFIGDAHSNFLKVIHALLNAQVLQFENFDRDYKELRECHEFFSRLTLKIEKFDFDEQGLKKIFYPSWVISELLNLIDILARLSIKQKAEIIFIGDTLADRNGCELLMFFVFHQLEYLDLKFKIIISNHDLYFIKWMEENILPSSIPAIRSSAISLFVLNNFIEWDITTKSAVKILYDSYYKKHLCLATYLVSKDLIPYVCVHGRVQDFEVFSQMALTLLTTLNPVTASNDFLTLTQEKEKFDLEWIKGFNQNNYPVLFKFIELLNNIFQTHFVNTDRIMKLYAEAPKCDPSTKLIPIAYPLEHLIWNRIVKEVKSEQFVRLIHGHDLGDSTPSRICLDDTFGKISIIMTGNSDSDLDSNSKFIWTGTQKQFMLIDSHKVDLRADVKEPAVSGSAVTDNKLTSSHSDSKIDRNPPIPTISSIRTPSPPPLPSAGNSDNKAASSTQATTTVSNDTKFSFSKKRKNDIFSDHDNQPPTKKLHFSSEPEPSVSSEPSVSDRNESKKNTHR